MRHKGVQRAFIGATNDQAAAMRQWGKRWESWTAARPKAGRPWMPEYDDTSWRTAPPGLGAWALWTGTNPDGFIGQIWMRTTVTLTPEQAAKLQHGVVLKQGVQQLGGPVRLCRLAGGEHTGQQQGQYQNDGGFAGCPHR